MLKTIGALLFVSLRATTVNGAQLLGMEKSLGAIRPGFLADIVAVDGDPLADIEVAIQKLRWVMKGGAVVVDRTK
jgi:imidazolonepropionase-like amidohydrolase